MPRLNTEFHRSLMLALCPNERARLRAIHFQLGPAAPAESYPHRIHCRLVRDSRRGLLSFSSCVSANRLSASRAAASQFDDREFRTDGNASTLDRLRGSGAGVNHQKTATPAAPRAGESCACSFLFCARAGFETTA